VLKDSSGSRNSSRRVGELGGRLRFRGWGSGGKLSESWGCEVDCREARVCDRVVGLEAVDVEGFRGGVIFQVLFETLAVGSKMKY
jgi:hypothetical protein